MGKIYKNMAILSIIATFAFYTGIISAQTENNEISDDDNANTIESSEIPEEIQTIINEDENVTADDLEVKEPTLLPGNPFYFVKNIGRTLKSATTFNQTKKAELALRFANERLMEIQKIAESNSNPEILTKALNKYEKELEKIKETTKKIKEKDSEITEKFVDKFIDNQIKHQKLLEKIKKEVPKEISEKIQENQQFAMQTLSDIPLLLTNADRFQEKIEKEMDEQIGSNFKNFKNLEILKELEDKVPETAKDAIRRAQENTINRLYEKMEKSVEIAEKLPLYVKYVNGNMEKHLEIINDLEIIADLDEQNISEEIKYTFGKARKINIERMENKIEQMEMGEQTGETIEDITDEKREKTGKTTALQQSSKEQIEKAASIIEKAKTNFELAKNNPTVSDKLNSALILIKNAQIHLEKARTAYDKELFGEAFGQSGAAIHNAANVIETFAKLEKDNRAKIKNDENNNTGDTSNDKKIENEINNDPAKKENNISTDEEKFCAQVITPAKNQKTGECREFPTACIPQGWYNVRFCEKNQINPTDKNSDTNTKNTATE